MFVIAFLRSVIPMLGCLIGLYLFTVRREHCQKKFHVCIIVTLVLEFAVFYFLFHEDTGGQGISISKILTFLMISLLIFWGGLYVYGGWSRIGIYIFATDSILGIGERIYLATWDYFSHRAA